MRRIILLLLVFSLWSCDHGLGPDDSKVLPTVTGISGTIYYANWPDASNLYDLRLVVFNNFPPPDILNAVVNNQATVYPPLGADALPFFVDSTEYTLPLPAGTYDYVVVAQQFGPLITTDWLAAGQYDVTPDSLPTAIEVITDSLAVGIDIYVDFDQLPIQPF